MNWYHEVDKKWLEARKKYLTATEIAGLVPEYKRMQKAKEGTISPGCAALWAEKHTVGMEDTASFGAAARGHWMEQPAIDAFNSRLNLTIDEEKAQWMYHWDDALISKGRVCFSPDAMTVEQTHFDTEWISLNGEMKCNSTDWVKNPTAIAEVKAFEPAHHMKCVIADKMAQEDKILMQIATAFYVLDGLEKAYLIFICPNTYVSMHVLEYTREDLEKQIELVRDIADLYKETDKALKDLDIPYFSAGCTEESVYKTMLEEQEARKGNILGL